MNRGGLGQLRTLDPSLANVKGLLDPIERESQGPQLVGLDADPSSGTPSRLTSVNNRRPAPRGN